MNFGAYAPRALPSPSNAPAEEIQQSSGQIGLTHLVNVVLRHRWLILGMIAAAMIVTICSIAMQTPVYEATATLRMDIPVATDGTERAIPTAESEMQIETETRTLASHDFASAMVRDLELLDNPAFSGRKISKGRTARAPQSRIDKAADQLLTMIQIQRVPHTQLINVSVQSPHPTFAAMVANRYVQIRQMHGALDRLQRQDKIIAKLAERTRQAGDELRKAEQAVADFRRANHMLVGAAGPGDLAQINQLTADAAAAASARAGAAAKAAGVSTAANMRPNAESASSPLLAVQEQRYAELLQRQAELSSFYGPGHPSLANVLAQIREVKGSLDAERSRVRRVASAERAIQASRETYLARSDAQDAAAREAALQQTLGALTLKAYRNSAGNVRLAELERTAETQRALYVGLSARLKQLGSALVSGTGLVLQSTAPVPVTPITPTPRKTLTIMLLGATILGFACAFALEMTDRRLRSAQQVWRLFGLQSFAMIPLMRSGVSRTTPGKMLSDHPNSLFSEAARTLHAEVMRRRHGPGAQVILITSPFPGDGKTAIAHSLGATAIAAGRSAVVIDLDLRRLPREDLLAASVTNLAPYLEGEEPLQGLLPSPSDAAPKALMILSAQKEIHDPNAVLSSPQLARLFDELRNRVDLIIIDAPPALAVRDASDILPLADMTLLVIRWGRTRIDEVAGALATLGEPISGVVLNAVDYRRHAQGRYGDMVQYFRRSRAYYPSDEELLQPTLLDRLLRRIRPTHDH